MRCMTRLGLVESMNSLKFYILIRLKYELNLIYSLFFNTIIIIINQKIKNKILIIS